MVIPPLRAIGILLLVAGLALTAYVTAVRPTPDSLAAFHRVVEASEGGVSTDGLRLVAPTGVSLRYDAERDATLVYTGTCDHEPCGPTAWIQGDLYAATPPPGPWLLLPARDGVVALESVDPGSTRGERLDVAFSVPFVIHSVHADTALRSLAVGAVLMAVAFLAPWPAGRAFVPAGAAAVGVGVGHAVSPMVWVVLIFVSPVLLLLGAIGLGLTALSVKRHHVLSPTGAAILLFLAGMVITLALRTPFYPSFGSEV